jgi:hypothetical protein
MGMHKYCLYTVPGFKLRGLCTRINPHSVGIVDTCVAGEAKHRSTVAGEIVEVTFEEVPGKDYRYRPTIKTFLEETSLNRLFQTKDSW